jgi:hypothetical protein
LRHRFGLITTAALALATALTIGVGSTEAPMAAASSSCSRHNSTSRPPSTIRVLRVHTGRIQRVPFRKYVVTVMGKEWPSYLPQPVIEAGAVAVKQYAWYHAIFSRRVSRAGCYDVKDSTSDQLYKPDRSRVRPDHYAAMNKTWNVSLRKDGRFFMTGYRSGAKVRCGKDRTGYKLYAKSAIQCARRGYGYQQILRTYYGPRLDMVGAGGGRSSARVTNVYAPDTTRAADATRVVKPRRAVKPTRVAEPRRAVESRRVVEPKPTRQAPPKTHRAPTTAPEAHSQVAPRTVEPSAEPSAFGGGLTGGIGAILDRRSTGVL